MKKIIILFVILFVFAPSSTFGEVLVYAANDDFLGYFMSFVDGGDEILIYVPSLGKFIQFEHLSNYQDSGKLEAIWIDYGESNCTGTLLYAPAVITEKKNVYFILRNCSKFYTFSDESGETVTFPYMSYKPSQTCTCTNENDFLDGYPLIEVTLPFDHPIALPLRFEHKIGNKSVVIPMFKSQ